MPSGALSHDLVRGAHYSHASSAVHGKIFHGTYPCRSGWSATERFGLAAFARRSDDCWLDELHGVLKDGVPVIVLMHFGPEVVDKVHNGAGVCSASGTRDRSTREEGVVVGFAR